MSFKLKRKKIKKIKINDTQDNLEWYKPQGEVYRYLELRHGANQDAELSQQHYDHQECFHDKPKICHIKINEKKK